MPRGGFDHVREELEQGWDADLEMGAGYVDGMKADSPEPSANRSNAYRHGFQMGRNDLAKSPGRGASAHRDEATAAVTADRQQ